MSNFDLSHFRNVDIFYSNYFFHLIDIKGFNRIFSKIHKYSKTKSTVIFNLISNNDKRCKNNSKYCYVDGVKWSFWDIKDILKVASKFNYNILSLKEVTEVEYINQKKDIVKFYFCVFSKK